LQKKTKAEKELQVQKKPTVRAYCLEFQEGSGEEKARNLLGGLRIYLCNPWKKGGGRTDKTQKAFVRLQEKKMKGSKRRETPSRKRSA